jgi:hypothetical protein
MQQMQRRRHHKRVIVTDALHSRRQQQSPVGGVGPVTVAGGGEAVRALPVILQ